MYWCRRISSKYCWVKEAKYRIVYKACYVVYERQLGQGGNKDTIFAYVCKKKHCYNKQETSKMGS